MSSGSRQKCSEACRLCRRASSEGGWDRWDDQQGLAGSCVSARCPMIFEHAPQCPSPLGEIRSVAEKIGCPVEVLRRWVRQAERDTGQRPGLTTERAGSPETARREMWTATIERDSQEGSAHFTQAELDRCAR